MQCIDAEKKSRPDLQITLRLMCSSDDCSFIVAGAVAACDLQQCPLLEKLSSQDGVMLPDP